MTRRVTGHAFTHVSNHRQEGYTEVRAARVAALRRATTEGCPLPLRQRGAIPPYACHIARLSKRQIWPRQASGRPFLFSHRDPRFT
jgi:hypothetical protein